MLLNAPDDTSVRRGQKSVDAYRLISEVATDLGVEPHVLRFWESKFKQIEPLKRAGGRRYYRPRDIDLLRRIQHLLHAQGYTIKGVQKLLKQDKYLSDVVVGAETAMLTESAQSHAAVNDDTQKLATSQATCQTAQLADILVQLKAIRAKL